MDTHPDETTILRALATLELKLTELIRHGITQIQQEHNRALLDQAKANATFADRERVERLAIKIENVAQEVIALHREDGVCGDDRRALHLALERVERSAESRSLRLATGSLGYLITAFIALSASTTTALVVHFLH